MPGESLQSSRIHEFAQGKRKFAQAQPVRFETRLAGDGLVGDKVDAQGPGLFGETGERGKQFKLPTRGADRVGRRQFSGGCEMQLGQSMTQQPIFVGIDVASLDVQPEGIGRRPVGAWRGGDGAEVIVNGNGKGRWWGCCLNSCRRQPVGDGLQERLGLGEDFQFSWSCQRFPQIGILVSQRPIQ